MEQKYFLIDGSDRKGPFTIQQLKELNIKKNDLVWHGGIYELDRSRASRRA